MASPHRTATVRCDVDTISHPTFLRQALVEVGGYDETLARNEDYETNYRLRRAGGRLVFTPEIRSVYRPRATLRQLARQFYAYGEGKATVARRHPESLRVRHLAPPALVIAAAASPFAMLHPAGRWCTGVAALAYSATLAVAAKRARPGDNNASLATFVGALPVMHLAWGTGVLRGLVRARSAPTSGR
jgi:succinoglycan biosynthesis protein ExoA